MKDGRVSAREAVYEVLRQARGEVAGNDLVRRVLEYPGVSLGGKTPASTVAAVITSEVQKGRILRPARGLYKLPA